MAKLLCEDCSLSQQVALAVHEPAGDIDSTSRNIRFSDRPAGVKRFSD
ncbi:MAG: hypothetical protein ACRD9W_07155 [Terriglobia bacterium]